MTQEERKLLLVDLSARLLYEVKIELMPITKGKCIILTPIILRDYFVSDNVNYLPYLRSMSSMTDKEYVEYSKLWNLQDEFPTDADIRLKVDVFDWLNKHHFDYRGLIEKGLALEAPEGMYNLNN